MTPYLEKILHPAVEGALVLTSNKRLSRHLRAEFDQMMLAEGRKAWSTPQIFSLDAWFERQADLLGESWRLLQGHAVRRVWEQIIEEDSKGSDKELLQLSATAEKARQAAQLLDEYQISLEGQPLTEDQDYFRKWLQSYKRICAERGWLDRAGMVDQVIAAIIAGKLLCPCKLLLAGFDQHSPLTARLSQAVESAGGTVLEVKAVASSAGNLVRTACTDPRDEIEKAARWTRQLLDRGEASIGIVVIDLQERRSQIERIFRDQISPDAALKLNSSETAFSLSLGSALIDQGPIFTALEILSVGVRVSLDQISLLLRTPYLKGGRAEADCRALFDRRLRSFRQQDFSTKALVSQATDEKIPAGCRVPGFSLCLERLSTSSRETKRMMPGAWAATFDDLLRDEKVGWPGDRQLTSNEYQMVKAWQDKLLPAMASLDAVSVPLERLQALALLRRLAAEIDFQLETASGPVQVIGLLESAGLEFDHLWIMGATENSLPAVSRPNPFLPVALQVAHQMPHGSAERELDFAQQVLSRLKSSSPDTVFSYALRDGDCDLRPSPLILDLEQSIPELAELEDCRVKIRTANLSLELLRDEQGPPLASGRGEGGTGILKDQALCPFRAFAHYRLRAREFDQPEAGLDAMTRGDLLHKALEILWRALRDQQQLLSLSGTARQERIVHSVAQAIELQFSESLLQKNRLIDIERDRLVALIEEWLTGFELDREPFEVIQLEEERLEQIGPLQIRIVIDRVDRLRDGSFIILDYKTGYIKADLLLGERLLEPQLPLYAITNSEREADGVAFAQLRRGACKLIGVARDGDLLPTVQAVEKNRQAQELGLSDWTEVLGHWRQQLESVADDFVRGYAKVDPVDRSVACKFCDLSGLCRIAEAESCEVDL